MKIDTLETNQTAENKEVYVVDVVFISGKGTACDCAVYADNSGLNPPLKKKKDIVAALQGKNMGLVVLENRYIRLKTKADYIESYNIKKIKENEF
ncbi:hypothetical protein BJV85_002819 [Clostridium acetobutylicum]|uniref:Uncharacterized protein n=1 Tax=Clostridium acetobutylicum (strain ATCC 824 / DSM 792 / JCM 1419 / IAM 19013 / LMG 5710 / NBRC 13948 / NRRL B-527 / VKM B-1787 / 2291 / W) TaxID=272562 RepID=Q97JU5_CLOAB|nr:MULTISPECIES: hypothetical protein [Clostridium]AAK79150.1 Hypothetical protein CA_C1178 [Clostridium acetobutylicum ATCC 824]ADZ20228.1 Conserved hypothetical protein [Clostridium acetobutylicum EA 2018]AEI31685.1 hypothetical protein SMB_G1198 [Clostridium acetobutylicum DSM 1731]AWV81597.1 hypothetical protein DK921_16160 [Clostridium acetobutylicum]MBC2393238.1 hypothetical protein [Clostridium acetobutylicum]